MPQPMSSTVRAGSREWVALGVLTLAVILLAVDGTILGLAVPSLTAGLNPSAVQILWIGDLYSFVLAGLLVTMGNLADRIGRKRLLLIGAVGFGVASAVAAFAPNAELLIAARALMGASGATIMPSTLSIIRNMFEDPGERRRAIAIWAAGATAGVAIGPLVGGALLENFWWGSVFLINIPIMVILVVGGLFLVPESRNPKSGPIDLVSAFLSIAAIVPIVYAIKDLATNGFELQGVVSVIIGLISGFWFVRRQRKLTYPLVDVSLFGRPAFSGALIANAIAVFAFSGLLFFFSQYLQLVRGFNPLLAGIAELPSTLAAIAVVFVVAFVTARLGVGRAIGVGLLVAAAGLVFLAFAEGMPTYFWIATALAVIGLGVGTATTLSIDAVVAAVPKERAGAASSIAETAYELGVALGIAVLGSITAVVYRANLALPAQLDEQTRAAVSESLATASRHLHQDDSLLVAAQHAFTSSMQLTAIIAGVLVFVAGVIAWRIIPSERTRETGSGHADNSEEGSNGTEVGAGNAER